MRQPIELIEQLPVHYGTVNTSCHNTNKIRSIDSGIGCASNSSLSGTKPPISPRTAGKRPAPIIPPGYAHRGDLIAVVVVRRRPRQRRRPRWRLLRSSTARTWASTTTSTWTSCCRSCRPRRSTYSPRRSIPTWVLTGWRLGSGARAVSLGFRFWGWVSGSGRDRGFFGEEFGTGVWGFYWAVWSAFTGFPKKVDVWRKWHKQLHVCPQDG